MLSISKSKKPAIFYWQNDMQPMGKKEKKKSLQIRFYCTPYSKGDMSLKMNLSAWNSITWLRSPLWIIEEKV